MTQAGTPVLSVVSGTYNRLPHLRRMVESARAALLPGIPYEIVLVDGGSTDGTLDWCKHQGDVRLIEHGELRGAIRAFNDGAHAARGRYVVLANDDVEFLPESLTHALIFMEDHPEIGIGAFTQDRNNRGWHVEGMSAIDPQGRQTAVPYGQVAIVPRWLGDRLGWWGDFGARTYGGDTMLSARAYEAGYPVAELKRSRIHDTTPADELREINNTRILYQGNHPDTQAYLDVYPRGPQIASVPQFPPPDAWPAPLLRIFYVPIFEAGHQVQRVQKRGLRDALRCAGLVHEFDYVGLAQGLGLQGMWARLVAEAHMFQPDLFLFQLHDQGTLTASQIKALVARHPRAVFVNWNGDYWPHNLTSDQGIALAKAFDVQLVVNAEVIPDLRRHGIGAAHWHIAYEPLVAGSTEDILYDAVFLGSAYSAQRVALANVLHSLGDAQIGLFGSGWPNTTTENTTYDFRRTGQIMRQAKIVIGDSQWPEAHGFVSDRLFNALAAGGGVLMHQWFSGIDDLGLVNEENCIIWQSLDDLPDIMRYWLDGRRDSRRQKIAQAGRNLVMARHSFDARVRELFTDILREAVSHVTR